MLALVIVVFLVCAVFVVSESWPTSSRAVFNYDNNEIRFYIPCRPCISNQTYDYSLLQKQCTICLHHSIFIPGYCGKCGTVTTIVLPQIVTIPDVLEMTVTSIVATDTNPIPVTVTRKMNFVVQRADAESVRHMPHDWIEIVSPIDAFVEKSLHLAVDMLIHSNTENSNNLIEIVDVSFPQDPNYLPHNQPLQQIYISTVNIQGCNILQSRLLLNSNPESNSSTISSGYFFPSILSSIRGCASYCEFSSREENFLTTAPMF